MEDRMDETGQVKNNVIIKTNNLLQTTANGVVDGGLGDALLL